MRQGKVWGWTELLIATPMFEAHRLYIKAGRRCSMHKHTFKANSFFVESGHLRIIVKKASYDLTDVTDLTARQFTEVPPGEYHRFEGVTDVYALEFYYPMPLSEDIQRLDHGGAVDAAALAEG